MFADDTTILIQVPSITYVSTQLNEVASTASTWADTNKMSLNKSKTKSLHIMTAETFSVLNVQIGGGYIEQVDHAKLPGIIKTVACLQSTTSI